MSRTPRGRRRRVRGWWRLFAPLREQPAYAAHLRAERELNERLARHDLAVTKVVKREVTRMLRNPTLLRAAPGDIVVFRCPGRVSEKARKLIGASMTRVFPRTVAVIVEEDAALSVVPQETSP